MLAAAKYSLRRTARETDRRRSLQQAIQYRQRHRPLSQRALMELLETERGTVLGLIMLAHVEPALVAGVVRRQLARRELGALKFSGRFFSFLIRALGHQIERL